MGREEVHSASPKIICSKMNVTNAAGFRTWSLEHFNRVQCSYAKRKELNFLARLQRSLQHIRISNRA